MSSDCSTFISPVEMLLTRPRGSCEAEGRLCGWRWAPCSRPAARGGPPGHTSIGTAPAHPPCLLP